MTTSERIKAAKAIAITAEVCGRNLSQPAVELMIVELSEFELKDVLKALRQCYRECKRGLFSLADVIQRLPGRPEDMAADEAWGIALNSELWNERVTAVVPQAVFAAFPFPIWAAGDKVGARMAFKSAWDRCVSEYGMEYGITLGYDAEGRAPVIESALRDGVISLEQACHALPEHDFEQEGMLIESKPAKALAPARG